MSCFDYVSRPHGSFDVIFLDPPYNKGLIEPVLKAIVDNDVLSDDGIIMLESDNTDFHGECRGLTIYRQRRYGRTFITIYKKDENE
jgi:16S rRNA G966 N2-methylase RsmD